MICKNYYHGIGIVCTNYSYYHQKNAIQKLWFYHNKNTKNEYISTLFSSYRVAASFITLKFLGQNTETEKFGKSRVLQKCLLMHLTLIITIIMIIIIIIIIIIHNTTLGSRLHHFPL